jgi:prepilin-type N-terminal cleavage/methylation domain-containing protein
VLRSRRDAGFTLIELLITIVILGTVVAALAAAMLGFTRNTDATIQRLGESHDAQITASYFGEDVASIGIRNAESILTQSVTTRAASPVAGCAMKGTPVVWLGWDDPTTATTATPIWVGYVVETISGQRQLHRLVCSASGALVSDIVMAHYLNGTPSVSCEPSRLGCDDPTSVPTSVTMKLSIKASDDSTSGYDVSLLGQRRQTS